MVWMVSMVDGGKFGIMEYDNVSIVEPKLGSHIPPKKLVKISN